MLVQPKSVGGNFEYLAIPRQGLLFISGALKQWSGPFLYDRDIWFEDHLGHIDPDKDLNGYDILMVTALINEVPRAYEIARQAKLHHPELIMIGGGPHMSPLSDEAIREGSFDVIVNREGEDIIGQLSDVLLTSHGTDLDKALFQIPGISFLRLGQLVQTPRHGVIKPDFVELPDFRSIIGLTDQRPMAGGVIETVRGCTEKCTYCQVIQQFLGYRMISREVEQKRLAQLNELAADGLIYTNKNGRFSVFISDDLHTPPLRAVKYRNERLGRLKAWNGQTANMHMICQARAEVGEDPELASAMMKAGIQMIYLGVESSSAENLKLVRKRQDPGQVHKDMQALTGMGFNLVAMTIIGLPYDTREGIMEMADWVRSVSKYQTANLLTPLPATSNWDLPPLDENGDELTDGKLRPYHLYTGRQFVFKDPRWTMQESRELYDKYYAKLNPVDKLYERVFRLMERKGTALAGGRPLLDPALTNKLTEVAVTLRELADSVGRDLTSNLTAKMQQASEALRSGTESMGELRGHVGLRIQEISDSLKSMADSTGKEMATTASDRLRQLSLSLTRLAESSPRM